MKIKWEKFHVGDHVKIVRLLDEMTNRELIGKKGTIEEVEDLPNGDYNYYVLVDWAGKAYRVGRLFTKQQTSLYMHEEELELDIPATVMDRLKGRG